jgi:hypothetical protein
MADLGRRRFLQALFATPVLASVALLPASLVGPAPEVHSRYLDFTALIAELKETYSRDVSQVVFDQDPFLKWLEKKRA